MIDGLKVLCAECRVEPQIGSGEAICPSCGQCDTVEETSATASDHFLHCELSRIDEARKPPALRSMFIQFEPQAVREKRFKWHAAES